MRQRTGPDTLVAQPATLSLRHERRQNQSRKRDSMRCTLLWGAKELKFIKCGLGRKKVYIQDPLERNFICQISQVGTQISEWLPVFLFLYSHVVK